jgi:hypothetical protein
MNCLLTYLGIVTLLSGSASAALARVYNVGGNVKAPVVLKRPPIDYSKCKLEGKRISGIPIGETVVAEDGQVASVKLVKGVEPCIDRTFLQNLRTWKFKPGTLKGKPVAVRMNFTLYIHYR